MPTLDNPQKRPARNGGARATSSRAELTAHRILAIARREGMQPGDRLIEQRLADELDLSRGPIRLGLKALAAAGVAKNEPNCGFVLAKGTHSVAAEAALATFRHGDEAYTAIAADRLSGDLPASVTESELMRRYGLSRPELQRLLDRTAAEGWMERTPGYGWRFAETLSSPEAYEQSLAFRAVIEPAAITQPGYQLPNEIIERLRQRQLRILGDELARMSLSEVFQSGCEFHEEIMRGTDNSFFVEALKRVNSIRRLFAYRTFADGPGMRRHIKDHLRLLDLLEAGRNVDAASLMVRHLRRSPLASGG
ncbi:GntR family transcriptional regulator [Bradyrhizobium sp. SSUT112]|uniref:GntR family transcriptional regulator n=1 Tax=Bradyrhizobium sp. SSUT112 TaxID=3040604 RepID=UPI00244A9E5C|nr:GntR family transcriptional regulator [Bradyrhizobium sp. SSUT112]MDH2350495.1 GntR family transcriptional regulator [Bradyrhizobium sp. SSUT112]